MSEGTETRLAGSPSHWPVKASPSVPFTSPPGTGRSLSARP